MKKTIYKNEELDRLINDYAKDPDRTLYLQILNHLKNRSLFSFDYFVTAEHQGKSYFHVYTYLDEEMLEGGYIRTNLYDVIEMARAEEKETGYRTDYIVVESVEGKEFTIALNDLQQIYEGDGMRRIYELIKHVNDITAFFYRPGTIRKEFVTESLIDKISDKDVLVFTTGTYDSYEEISEEINNCEKFDEQEFPVFLNILGAVVIEDIHLLDQVDINRLKELKGSDVSVVLLCKLPRRVDMNPEGRAIYDRDFKTVNGETIEDKDLKHINIDDYDNIIEVYSPWDEENLLHKETEFIVHKNKYGDPFTVKTVYIAETFDYESVTGD